MRTVARVAVARAAVHAVVASEHVKKGRIAKNVSRGGHHVQLGRRELAAASGRSRDNEPNLTATAMRQTTTHNRPSYHPIRSQLAPPALRPAKVVVLK